ncbi:PREDICTED: neutrophil gelatinase-associated lipocalin-like [Chinchilla lanigera]|uniref:neutrophil gelatinase-associated lipocalin-like n=1 Tax=Chinchilla lanigera TaxID=34839 RepID=UPI00038EFB09|nr:PREDICTED: neutrophil gelatinase-associated lipocalin-like [Chinchilla lanigera]
MALHLLWLGLILLGALQTQAQDSSSRPSLSMVPLQADFQEDKFQGKWYVIGVAENTIQNGSQRQLKMYSVTYELKDDHSYNVTTTLLRGKFCDYWIRTVVPSVHPGQFTLGNITLYVGTQSYTMRVVNTNYDEVAIVFFEKIFRNTVYFKITLYGRTKELSPELKNYFVHFAKYLGFTDDNILFTAPNGNGRLGERKGMWDSPGLMMPHRGKGTGETQAPTPITGKFVVKIWGASDLKRPLFFLSPRCHLAAPAATTPVGELEDSTYSALFYTDHPQFQPPRGTPFSTK